MRRFVFFVALLVAGALTAFAQDAVKASDKLPTIDGVVNPGEYAFSKSAAGMIISVTLGTDSNVYIAVQSPAAGWVASGIGSLVMNGATLFLAYDANGKQFFTEQSGSGHSHSDAKDQIVKKWSVKTVDGKTTLEVVVPQTAALVKGNIDVLFSYSTGLNLGAHHTNRGSFALQVQK